MEKIKLNDVVVATETKTFTSKDSGEIVSYVEYTFFISGVPVQMKPSKKDSSLLTYLITASK